MSAALGAMLSVVLSVALWLLVALVGLIALLVALVVLLPLHLEARGAVGEDHLDGRIQLRWGGALVWLRADSAAGVDLRLLGLRVWRLRSLGGRAKARREADATDDAAGDARPKASRRGPSARRLWAHRRGLLRLLRAVLRAMPVRGHLVGTIGLSDPADTAVVFGVLDQIAERSAAIDIDIGPDWVDETVDLDGAIGVRLWPAHVLAAVCWQLIRDGQSRRGALALMRAS